MTEANKRAIERVVKFIMDDEWVLDNLKSPPPGGDVFFDWAEEVICKPIMNIICTELGHIPVVDMCGKPEHDYCVRCHEATPGQGARQ